MTHIVIYTKKMCPYCIRAKALLDSKKLNYQEITIDEAPDQRSEMERLSGRRTVPQIFINGQAIGGCDDLFALAETGELMNML